MASRACPNDDEYARALAKSDDAIAGLEGGAA